MTSKKSTTFGIFKMRSEVEDAIQALKSGGFQRSAISVLFCEKDGGLDFAHEKATKAPEGATMGGAAGALFGGTIGYLLGIGSIALPGIGLFMGAGPVMATLAGAGLGSTLGGIAGALGGMGIPEYEAKRYEGLVKAGGILLSVHCETPVMTKRSKEILQLVGAEAIASVRDPKTGSVLRRASMHRRGEFGKNVPVIVRDHPVGERVVQAGDSW
jgi:hypothetical protein